MSNYAQKLIKFSIIMRMYVCTCVSLCQRISKQSANSYIYIFNKTQFALANWVPSHTYIHTYIYIDFNYHLQAQAYRHFSTSVYTYSYFLHSLPRQSAKIKWRKYERWWSWHCFCTHRSPPTPSHTIISCLTI